MTAASFNPGRPPQVIERPPCTECGQPMYLTRIEPDKPGHDLRHFECALCGHSTSQVVQFKPSGDVIRTDDT